MLRTFVLMGVVSLLFACGGDESFYDGEIDQDSYDNYENDNTNPLVDEWEVDPSAVIQQSDEDALLEDLELVAQANGWTFEQALADRQAADAVGRVAEELASLRPDLFVGSKVAPEPGGVPTLYVKGPMNGLVYRLTAASDVPIRVADNQPYSFTELEERSQRLHQSLVAEGYDDILTSFEIENRGRMHALVTRVPGKSAHEAGLARLVPSDMRNDVVLSFTDDPVGVDDAAFAGMRVRGRSNCTSGWSVRSGGTTGVTTAGHCRNIRLVVDPRGGTARYTLRREHRGGFGDVEWGTTTTNEPAKFYADNRTVRNTTQLERRANISVGETVCVYGRSSGRRNCRYRVRDLSVSCTVSGFFNNRLVRMTGYATRGGDSGGPWFWANRAYGSTKGRCGGRSVWTVADYYTRAIGATVITTSGEPPRPPRPPPPSGGNLARRGIASQSSTVLGGVAARAIDGNTNGDWRAGSVTHTRPERQPYWDLDLRRSRRIRRIVVWNRTDCCAARLRNFHVFVSNRPFRGRTVAASRRQRGVKDMHFRGVARRRETFNANRSGRYVRIQLSSNVVNGDNVVSLAEVQVFSR